PNGENRHLAVTVGRNDRRPDEDLVGLPVLWIADGHALSILLERSGAADEAVAVGDALAPIDVRPRPAGDATRTVGETLRRARTTGERPASRHALRPRHVRARTASGAVRVGHALHADEVRSRAARRAGGGHALVTRRDRPRTARLTFLV